MATQRIDTKTTRLRLSPRREPYWHKITSGGHVGYRRTESGGSWLSRYRPKDGKRQFESFGEFPDIDPIDQFDHAQKAAIDWINSLGITTEAGYTVKKAIDDYVKYLRINNSDSSATQTQQRLYKRIPSKLQAAKLTKLTLKQITDWHCSMITESKDKDVTRRSKDTANRILSMFKAALNLAFRNNIIATDLAWRRVSAFKNVTTSRKVILTDHHIQRLYENTKSGFHSLIKSALLTGARYGELIQAKVSDFDPREGTLYLDGKTGSRECYLNAETVQHLIKLSIDKLPSASLHIKDDGSLWKTAHQSRPMIEAVEAAKLPHGTTFYALRHTHISRALLAGVNSQVIAENCGTSVRMIEKHYGKFMKADRRAMFDKVKLG